MSAQVGQSFFMNTVSLPTRRVYRLYNRDPCATAGSARPAVSISSIKAADGRMEDMKIPHDVERRMQVATDGCGVSRRYASAQTLGGSFGDGEMMPASGGMATGS